MTLLRSLRVGALVASLLALPAQAADYPTPKQGQWIARGPIQLVHEGEDWDTAHPTNLE